LYSYEAKLKGEELAYLPLVMTSGGLLGEGKCNFRIHKIQETAALTKEIQLLGTVV
jgi:hypothetical protein